MHSPAAAKDIFLRQFTIDQESFCCCSLQDRLFVCRLAQQSVSSCSSKPAVTRQLQAAQKDDSATWFKV
jgi:hypothetical protein